MRDGMPSHQSAECGPRSMTQATLVSASSPDELIERLAGLLPRFTLSGEPLPRFGISFSRYYLGRISGRSFRLSGPYPPSVPRVSLSASVEEGPEGSRTHLTLNSTAHYIPLMIWAVGVLGSGVFAFQTQMIILPLVFATFFGIFAALFYRLARRNERNSFHELVDCLARLLDAERPR